MTDTTNAERTPAQFHARAIAVHSTFARARRAMATEKTVEAALEYCHQRERLKHARAALPPLRLVVSVPVEKPMQAKVSVRVLA